MNKILNKKIKEAPKKSGVYLLKDASGRIIYIGKAKNLKKRIQAHFAKTSIFFTNQFIPFKKENKNRQEKERESLAKGVIGKISDIDWIETENEKQALLLESQLIKKYKPRYNIQWRDDKSYFWVSFSNDEWPKVLIVHKNKILHHPQLPERKISKSIFNNSRAPKKIIASAHQILTQEKLTERTNRIIGPFTHGRELRQILRLLRKIIPYRTCKNPYEKPCLQWHLGLCPAHLTPLSPEQTEKLPQKTNSLALSPYAKLSSENKLRNYLNSLNTLSQFLRLYAGEPIRIEAYDISNIQGKYATGSMIVFNGDRPAKSDYRRFRIKTVCGANDVAMIKEVLKRRFCHPEWSFPDLILIDGGIAQLKAANSVINRSKLRIPAVALAKRKEEIYTEYSQKPVKLNSFPEPLKLIFKAIRDEAHRFAIFYYRYLHETRGFGKIRKRDRKKKKQLNKSAKNQG